MFNVWNYGSNFANVDVLFSNANEPANNSSGGSTEMYAVYRGQLSPDKIFGWNTGFGPIQAINFEFGGDAETENTQFAPDKKLLIVGPNFHIGIPAGFLNVGVHFSKEWNNNGICHDACSTGSGGPVSFNPAPEFEVVWLYPLASLACRMDFRGFLNAVGPKGTDGFGDHTYWEILARPQINLDHRQDAVQQAAHPRYLSGGRNVAAQIRQLQLGVRLFADRSDDRYGGALLIRQQAGEPHERSIAYRADDTVAPRRARVI